MTTETWYKIWCDVCNAVNWICDGDTSDLTKCDIDGFVCHNCTSVQPFMEDKPGDSDSYEIGSEQPS